MSKTYVFSVISVYDQIACFYKTENVFVPTGLSCFPLETRYLMQASYTATSVGVHI